MKKINRYHRDERGVFLPLAMLLVTVLLSAVALSTYSVYISAKRQEARIVAESVSLAAAKELCSSKTCENNARMVAYTLLQQHGAVIDPINDIIIGRVFSAPSRIGEINFQSLENYETKNRGMVRPIIANGVKITARLPILGMSSLGSIGASTGSVTADSYATRMNKQILTNGVTVVPMGVPLCWLVDYKLRLNPKLLNSANRYVVGKPEAIYVDESSEEAFTESTLLKTWSGRLSCVQQAVDTNKQDVLSPDLTDLMQSKMARLQKEYIGPTSSRFSVNVYATAGSNEHTGASATISPDYFTDSAPGRLASLTNPEDSSEKSYLSADQLGAFITPCEESSGVEIDDRTGTFKSFLGQAVCATDSFSDKPMTLLADSVKAAEDSDDIQGSDGYSGVGIGFPAAFKSIEPGKAPCNSYVLTTAYELMKRLPLVGDYAKFNNDYRSILLPSRPEDTLVGSERVCNEKTTKVCVHKPTPSPAPSARGQKGSGKMVGQHYEDNDDDKECKEVKRTECVDEPRYRKPNDQEIGEQISRRIVDTEKKNELQRLISIVRRSGVDVVLPVIARDGNQDACYGGISIAGNLHPKQYSESKIYEPSDSRYSVVGFVPARIFDADFSNQSSGMDANPKDGLKDAPSCNMVKLRLKLNTEDSLLHLPSNAISSGAVGRRDEEVFLINPNIISDPARRTPSRGEPQNIRNIYEEQLCYDREADDGSSGDEPKGGPIENEPSGEDRPAEHM